MQPFISKIEYDTFDEETKQWCLATLVCHGQLERYFGYCTSCEGPAMLRQHDYLGGWGYCCTTCGMFYLQHVQPGEEAETVHSVSAALDEPRTLPYPALSWNAEVMQNYFEEQGF